MLTLQRRPSILASSAGCIKERTPCVVLPELLRKQLHALDHFTHTYHEPGTSRAIARCLIQHAKQIFKSVSWLKIDAIRCL